MSAHLHPLPHHDPTSNSATISSVHESIRVKQINLHHCKSATFLIDNALQTAQTRKQKTIVLIQEPYIDMHSHKVLGFNTQHCNVLLLNKGMKPRTCIVATKDVPITVLPQFCDGDTTTVLCTSTNGECDEFILSSSYMPGDTRDRRPGALIIELYNYCSVSKKSLVLGSDTNSHHTVWGSSNINTYGEELMEFLATTNLEVINHGNEPTFVTKSRKEVLDVTFASAQFLDRIANWHVSPEETASDHREINFDILIKKEAFRPFKNPRKTDWNGYTAILERFLDQMAWNANISTPEHLDAAVEQLTHGIHSAYMQSCPDSSFKPKRNVWWSKKLGSLRKECRKLLRSYSNGPEGAKAARWATYKSKRNEYLSLIVKSKKDSEVKFFSEVEGATAMARVHKILASDPLNSPGVLRHLNGDLTKSHDEAAKLLMNTHFPGNVEPAAHAATDGINRYEPHDTDVVGKIVSFDKTFWAIHDFKPYKSPGYDGIYPVLLQKAWPLLHKYLMDVYRASLCLGHVPKAWQKVKVVFIPKPGKEDYCSPKSFRPISLTSFMLKGLEKMVDRYIKDFLSSNSPISRDQHAFQEGKSTETALHTLTTLIEESIAQKEFAICTFLDIEGAFDNTPYTAVDKSLSERRVNATVRRWTSSLLRDRNITYETYGREISVIPTRGTPQGGVLSPTLWNLVIDELLNRLNREGFSVIGYADDITIICRGKFLNTLCETTQVALCTVSEWCKEVGLGVNPRKTDLVVFTKRRNLSGFIAPSLSGIPLTRGEKVKYLGITFTSNLNWNEHITHRITKCMRVFWSCRRAIGRTWGLRPRNLLWLHTAIVKPMLAYGSFIWWKGTTIANNCKLLNHLQRTVCLAITGAAKTAPQLALETMLNIPKLETYIQAEARITALRLQSLIRRRYSWRQDHSSIAEEAFGYCESLRAPVDHTLPVYMFDRRYRVAILSPDDPGNIMGVADPHTDRWFIDTSVNVKHFGFGIFNMNTETSYCGPLGSDMEETQAVLATIFRCCTEIIAANGNNPIYLYTKSLGAVKSLEKYKIESKLVMECVEMLSKIAEHRNITVIWTSTSHGDSCFNKANILAKEGASITLYGPEPFFPLTDRKFRQTCNEWVAKGMKQTWLNTASCSHTKAFIDSPDLKLTEKLLKLNKFQVSTVVSLITGHIRLNNYLNVLGVRDDPDCDRCGGGAETAMHFLCVCPGYNALRKSIFGCIHLNTREAVTSKIWRISCFAQRSGRFPLMESSLTHCLTPYRPHGRDTGINAVSPLSNQPPQQTFG